MAGNAYGKKSDGGLGQCNDSPVRPDPAVVRIRSHYITNDGSPAGPSDVLGAGAAGADGGVGNGAGGDLDLTGSRVSGARARFQNSTVLSTGHFRLRIPLLSVGGLSVGGWRFEIEHLRHMGIDGILGPNVNFCQNIHLEEDDGDVVLVTADNLHQRFVPTGTRVYSSEANNTAALLVRSAPPAEDEFTLTSSRGTVTKFYGFNVTGTAAPGRVKSVADRYGNTQTFTWIRTSGMDQLTEVEDNYGRRILYRYYEEGHHQLREIEDPQGRKLNFQYDADRRLVAVVTPSVNRGAGDNGFPAGAAYVFQYYSNEVPDAPEEQRDNLIRAWYPNETWEYVDPETREVDVEEVYPNATPRYEVKYGTDPGDADAYGRVASETVGKEGGPGGTYDFLYTEEFLTENLVDPLDPIVQRTVVTDRNGNQRVHDFNGNDMPVRIEVIRTHNKIDVPDHPLPESYVTWMRYNEHNQPTLVIYPEGNSVEYEYDTGQVTGFADTYVRRIGLLVKETQRPGNDSGIETVRSGSSGQTELTRTFFYEPVYNELCAVIERRGNPVDYDNETPVYFEPQNGGTTPTDSDRSRYATIRYFDYQQNDLATIKNDADLQELLFPLDNAATAASNIEKLVTHASNQMKDGGLPDGFEMGPTGAEGLGDINGDGTGNGASSGLPPAKMQGGIVKLKHPDVRQLVENPDYPESGYPWEWGAQQRVELFTNNHRGQVTTRTDPEGNLTVYVRYPENDPEGDGQSLCDSKTAKQYGRLMEIHRDADPDDVMSLVGADGDLADFKATVYPRNDRSNTQGQYLDLVTCRQGIPGGSPAYDVAGNVLCETDPRGFTTVYDRNELGRVYRITSPAPYHYRREVYYDANGNIVREDVEDKVTAYLSDDPTDPDYARFLPTGSGSTAHVPSKPGSGGSLRPGWFTDLYEYNLLDDRTLADIDATGSPADRLKIYYFYDANQNITMVTKPEGNTIEYDYDERNLRIARRVGRDPDAEEDGAVTLSVFDGNGNLIHMVGATDRLGTAGPTTLTVDLAYAFGSTEPGPVSYTHDWLLENTYDGFDRVIQAKDAIGNVTDYGLAHDTLACYDPEGRLIRVFQAGPAQGPSPADRLGKANVPLVEASVFYDEAGRAYDERREVFLNTAINGDYGAPVHILPSGRYVYHTGGGLEENAETNGHIGQVTLTATNPPTENQSYVLSRKVYDRSGRLTVLALDNTARLHYEYDGAGRRTKTVDAQGQQDENPTALNNTVDMTYDGNGNLIHVCRTDKADILNPPTSPPAPAGLATEVFEARLSYDALNRLVVAADQGPDGTITEDPVAFCTTPDDTQTLVTRVGYDSRGNQTLVIDPKGNTGIAVHDAAGRMLESIQHLRRDGEGGNPPEGNGSFEPDGGASVRTRNVYDGNGRLTELIDDRGGTTVFAYDTLDRPITTTFHDGSERTTDYNPAGDMIAYKDENGTKFGDLAVPEVGFEYDAIGRLRKVYVTDPAMGVAGTTAQEFEYDGLSRLTFARDTIGATHADCTFRHDSLGRLVEERQTYDGAYGDATYHDFTSWTPTGFTYPNTSQVTFEYDELYRRTKVDDGDIATWSFFGYSSVAELRLGNGLVCTTLNNARTRSARQEGVTTDPFWGGRGDDRLGYDGAGRMITKRYLPEGLNANNGYSNTTAFVGFTAWYDDASNKQYERHLHAESRSHLYPALDSIDRLRQYQRGTLAYNETTGVVTRPTPITLPDTFADRVYDLDGLGNWRRLTSTPYGDPSPDATTEVRQHNYLNQVTEFDDETDVLYDHGDNAASSDPDVQRRGNGNVADDGTRLYKYDAFNRLKEVRKKDGDTLIATYTYDALGRRLRKVVSAGGLSGDIPNGMTTFLYAGAQCIEERNNSNQTFRQYVWGRYVDELTQQKNIDGETHTDYYLLSDLLYRSVALTDTDKDIVEVYDTDAYGNTLIFDEAGTGGDWFANDASTTNDPTCQFIFTGLRYDPETRLYYSRARYLHPQMGRFISRDPIGYVDGLSLYNALGSNPTGTLDPFGMGPVQDRAVGFGVLLDATRKWEAGRPSETAAARLSAWANEVRSNGKFGSGGSLSAGTTAGTPGPGLGWKYLATKDAGWIDLGHFAEAAKWAARSPLSQLQAGRWIGGVGGQINEFMQGLANYVPGYPYSTTSSAYSSEDNLSNILGAQFGAYYRDLLGKDPNKSLADALGAFIAGWRPFDNPCLAPGFGDLPERQEVLEMMEGLLGYLGRIDAMRNRYQEFAGGHKWYIPGVDAVMDVFRGVRKSRAEARALENIRQAREAQWYYMRRDVRRSGAPFSSLF